jgi:hypothetical protein
MMKRLPLLCFVLALLTLSACHPILTGTSVSAPFVRQGESIDVSITYQMQNGATLWSPLDAVYGAAIQVPNGIKIESIEGRFTTGVERVPAMEAAFTAEPGHYLRVYRSTDLPAGGEPGSTITVSLRADAMPGSHQIKFIMIGWDPSYSGFDLAIGNISTSPMNVYDFALVPNDHQVTVDIASAATPEPGGWTTQGLPGSSIYVGSADLDSDGDLEILGVFDVLHPDYPNELFASRIGLEIRSFDQNTGTWGSEFLTDTFEEVKSTNARDGILTDMNGDGHVDLVLWTQVYGPPYYVFDPLYWYLAYWVTPEERGIIVKYGTGDPQDWFAGFSSIPISEPASLDFDDFVDRPQSVQVGDFGYGLGQDVFVTTELSPGYTNNFSFLEAADSPSLPFRNLPDMATMLSPAGTRIVDVNDSFREAMVSSGVGFITNETPPRSRSQLDVKIYATSSGATLPTVTNTVEIKGEGRQGQEADLNDDGREDFVIETRDTLTNRNLLVILHSVPTPNSWSHTLEVQAELDQWQGQDFEDLLHWSLIDLDGDGRLDIYGQALAPTPSGGSPAPPFAVAWRQDAVGVFHESPLFAAPLAEAIPGYPGSEQQIIAQGDFDGDGVDEILVGRDGRALKLMRPRAQALNAEAAGTVAISSGSSEDVLTVNGSAGDLLDRTVTIPAGAPITVAVASPTTTPLGVAPLFAVWGKLGVINASDLTTTGIGTFTMPIAPFIMDPLYFTLVDSFFAPNGLVGANPAPWSWTLNSGLIDPVDLALTGVIEDASAPSGYAVMNTVRVAVR